MFFTLMDSGQWGETVKSFCYFGSSLAVLQMMKDYNKWGKNNNYITFVEGGIVEIVLIPVKMQINHKCKTLYFLDFHQQSYWTCIYEFPMKSINNEWNVLVSTT